MREKVPGIIQSGSGYLIKTKKKPVPKGEGIQPVGSLPGTVTTTVTQSFEILNPDKWSAEYPNLYTLVIELLDKEQQVVEILSSKVGFREVEVIDQAICVNGVPIKFNGVNSHMIHPETGHTMDVETMRKDLYLMKQFNINCVRTSHYPPNMEYLEMADELGIYIVDETGDEAHAYIQISHNPEWRNQYLDRMRKMVYRDRNHPSVVIWSAGNESGPGDNLCIIMEEGKRIDPSRPAWMYHTFCSDTTNVGLHGMEGIFECTENENLLAIYSKGRITREIGSYHLNHEDGTPFFWQACTAWNGGLKSTPEEWEHYLKQRADHGYNVIQLVGTQWRGCDQNSEGEIAFTGSGRIILNPDFFQHFDGKMDRVNAHGHLAGLVLLWALPFGKGMELSPGYYLPDREAILLARYMVARYGAHHVTWILGGDGKFFAELEDRWMHIGREVFHDKPQGLSTLHPHGRSWIGGIYGDEGWFDIDGYQSSHGTGKGTVNFINNTIAGGWKTTPPKPVINLEPCYEKIFYTIFDDDVRNASYWSVFAAPPSGITYGANGIWPWIREGEMPLNHGFTSKVDTWKKSIEFPGSKQIGYLGAFMRSFDWWEFLPAQQLLLEQPGEEDYRKHISVLKSEDSQQILVYFPVKQGAKIHLPPGSVYTVSWFDPVRNEIQKTSIRSGGRVLVIESPFEKDAVLILKGAV